MRIRSAIILSTVSAMLLGFAAPARADHFDGDAGTGTFNPILTMTLTPAVPKVNQPTAFALKLTQQDHEDPPVFSRFRAPGDWGFAWSTRQAETPPPASMPTTDCDDAIDGLDDSPDGAGPANNANRGNAKIVRAEKIGTTSLRAVADGFGRGDPAGPIVFNGDAAFISFNPVTNVGQLCLLLITRDTRVVNVADPIPGNGGDDLEGITEIVAQFPLAFVTEAGVNYWEVFADLSELVESSELQTLNVSLLEFNLSVLAHSVGNWDAGGEDFSRASSTSGPHAFTGRFQTCNVSIGNCASSEPIVNRTLPFSVVLPSPSITAPAGSGPFPANVTVSGTTVDPNTNVRLYSNGSAVSGAEVISTGNTWSMNVTLPHGTNNLTARVFDAGGVSDPSAVKTITIDAIAPAPPVINAPGAGATVPTGSVEISGSAEPGSIVKVTEGLATLGTATASAGGAWSISSVFNVKGSHTVSATATDGVGNVGLPSNRTFNVTTPSPVITVPSEGAFLANGNVTFVGTSEVGSTVELSISNVPFASIVAVDGTWSAGPFNFGEGIHAITAIATGADSFVSLPIVRTFTVDLTPPPAPTITAPLDGATVSTASVPVAGTAEAFANVQIFEEGVQIGSAAASAGGLWSTNIEMANGAHTIVARAVDRAGNQSPLSNMVSFNVAALLVTITDPAQNSFQPASVTVKGTAEAGATFVLVYDGGIQVAKTPVTDGKWSKALTLTSGLHTLTARGTNDEVSGPLSNARSFTVDAVAPRLTIIKPSGYLLFQFTLLAPDVRALAEEIHSFDSGIAGFELTYTPILADGETMVRAGSCTGCGTKDAAVTDTPPLGLGLWEVTVKVTDKVGNVATDTALLFSLGV